MAGAFDDFKRPDQANTAGSAFEPVTWQQQLGNYRALEGAENAWRQAEGSPWKPAPPGPLVKTLGDALASTLGQRAMTLADFMGPGPKMPRPVLSAAGGGGGGPKVVKAFHGSPHEFDKFDLNRAQEREKAVFLSSKEDDAREFGAMANPSKDPVMYEVALPEDKIKYYRWSDYDKDPMYMPETMEKILADARRDGTPVAGIKGVENFEGSNKSTTYAAFDPSVIEIIRKYGLAALLLGGVTGARDGSGEE